MEKKAKHAVKKIDPNEADKLMRKEREVFNPQPKLNAFEEELSFIDAYLEVFDGYLSSDNAGNDLPYGDKVFLFMEDLQGRVKKCQEMLKEFRGELWKHGHLGSYLEGNGDKTVFVKCQTTIERIPTTYLVQGRSGRREKEGSLTL